MSNALNSRLMGLYSPTEQTQMRKIANAMLDDPTVFDTHSREVRNLPDPAVKEKESGKA